MSYDSRKERERDQAELAVFYQDALAHGEIMENYPLRPMIFNAENENYLRFIGMKGLDDWQTRRYAFKREAQTQYHLRAFSSSAIYAYYQLHYSAPALVLSDDKQEATLIFRTKNEDEYASCTLPVSVVTMQLQQAWDKSTDRLNRFAGKGMLDATINGYNRAMARRSSETSYRNLRLFKAMIGETTQPQIKTDPLEVTDGGHRISKEEWYSLFSHAPQQKLTEYLTYKFTGN